MLDPLLFLLLAAAFAGFVWWGHKSGEAVMRYPFRIRRDKSPTAFWIIQALYALGAAGLAACGIGIWAGWLPD
jgi:hypothetical protein